RALRSRWPRPWPDDRGLRETRRGCRGCRRRRRRPARWGTAWSCCSSRRRGDRKPDGERGASVGHVARGDRPAVRADNLARDVEAETEATVVAHRRRALEPLEDAAAVLLRHAGAVIP